MRKLILHMGDFKTGSTALQTELARFHDPLLSKGFLYPDFSGNSDYSKRGINVGGNAQKIARAMIGPEDEHFASLDSLFSQLEKLIKTSHQNIILSSEWFSLVDIDLINQLYLIARKRRLSVHGVFFLRSPLKQIISNKSEFVKSNLDINKSTNDPIFMDSYIDGNFSFLQQTIEKITYIDENIFPVRMFNFEDAKGDIFGFFLEKVLDLDREQMGPHGKPVKGNQRVNRSLTDHEETMFNYLNRMEISSPLRQSIVQNLMLMEPHQPWVKAISDREIDRSLALFSNELSEAINKKIEGTPISIAASPQESSEDAIDTNLRLFALMLKVLDEHIVTKDDHTRAKSDNLEYNKGRRGAEDHGHCVPEEGLHAKQEKLRVSEDASAERANFAQASASQPSSSRPQQIAKISDYLDSKLHKWISDFTTFPDGVRRRLRKASEKRRRSSSG
ncbi:MAG: hypothetical protein AAGH74_04875 [Pseudomonadota bacterium]